jgi:hypothetical protein
MTIYYLLKVNRLGKKFSSLYLEAKRQRHEHKRLWGTDLAACDKEGRDCSRDRDSEDQRYLWPDIHRQSSGTRLETVKLSYREEM